MLLLTRTLMPLRNTPQGRLSGTPAVLAYGTINCSLVVQFLRRNFEH